MNLMMLLEMAAQGFGERVAFVNGDESLTYKQLFDAAGQAGVRLRDGACQHVAMLDVSSLALPIGLFASAWAGKPFVPINYRLASHEVEGLVSRIEPAFIITDAERIASWTSRSEAELEAREAFVDFACDGTRPLENDWPMAPDDIAVLLFTSGTTGTPKAAVLRHRHLVSYMFSAVEFGSAAEDEVALVTVPPYHIAGVISVISSIYAGRRVVQLPNFNARDWIDIARRERVTNGFLVPTMLSQIVSELEGQDSANLPLLASISYGGGKMPQPVIERAMALLPNTKFTQAYGLTETSSTICVLLPWEHRAAGASNDPAERRRLTSVGRPLPGVELQIRDEEGRALPPGHRGEIYVRGDQVSGEYVGRGSVLDAQGWFPTRDAGELDEEGYLFLEGRADDVIVRGAENMSPGEIEDVLLRHPAVLDVCVVGVPDEHWGEAVAAVVVLRPGGEATTDELRDCVRSQLRSSRVPQFINFASELPYNETGKLLRRIIRANWAAN
ncbi:MAG: class I adenylate-forming enzyme family protein [Halioglobus sp.]|nr:class I adenylate-forming enzyme family protein [Halioglobus sp.]